MPGFWFLYGNEIKYNCIYYGTNLGLFLFSQQRFKLCGWFRWVRVWALYEFILIKSFITTFSIIFIKTEIFIL